MIEISLFLYFHLHISEKLLVKVRQILFDRKEMSICESLYNLSFTIDKFDVDEKFFLV